MGWREWLGLAPTRDDFARRLMRMAEQRGSTGWVYNASEAVLHQGSNSMQVHLSNLYLEYSRAQKTARADLLEKYLAMLTSGGRDVPQLWDLAARAVYPVVRSRYAVLTLEIASRVEATPFPPPIRWPWLGDLVISVVYDFGPHMAQVKQDMIDTWGQTPQTVRERALANLRALTRPQWQPLEGGAFVLASEVSYEESFFLVDAIFDSLKVRGAPVIAIPNRGVLLAAGSEDPAALETLMQHAYQSIQSAPWPLSGLLLQRAANGWQIFEPPAALKARAQALQTLSLAITYGDQQKALQEHCNKTGDDVYVATFSMLRPQQEPLALQSWCSWAQGIASLLPRTDLIGFTKAPETPEPETLMVPWSEVERICPYHFRKTTEDPVRYRVESFPTDTEWQQLKSAALQPG